jgi:hypothetical protein
MTDAQLILLGGALLGAVFALVFVDGGHLSDRFMAILLLAPSVSYSTCIYVLEFAGAELALQSLLVGQGALIVTLIAAETLLSRRRPPRR